MQYVKDWEIAQFRKEIALGFVHTKAVLDFTFLLLHLFAAFTNMV